MTVRHYSSTAVTTALSSGIDGSATSMAVDSTTGFPTQFPFTLAVDIDTPSEELVDVTAAVGNTLTVTRGVDGTVGLTHEAGAVVKHVITGRDLQNSRDHEEASTNVHGVGSGNSVVGTNTVQTLEGKTIDGGLNTLQNVPQSAVTNLVTDQGTQDSRLTTNEGNISSVTSDLSNHKASTAVHGVGGVVGRTEAQTLTNKTISGSNNTITDLPDAGSTSYINVATTGSWSGTVRMAKVYKTVHLLISGADNVARNSGINDTTVLVSGGIPSTFRPVVDLNTTFWQYAEGVRIRGIRGLITTGGSIQLDGNRTTDDNQLTTRPIYILASWPVL